MTISFVTTTSHGTWLPGDVRGYVRKGVRLPGEAKLLKLSQQQMRTRPVYFTLFERNRLFDALRTACAEFEYRLSDVAIEPWHLHWILFHDIDAIEVVVGRLKTRMRQAVGRGRIWTEGYCAEPLFDDRAVACAQEYIAQHEGCRMLDGRIIQPQTPGRAGGCRA